MISMTTAFIIILAAFFVCAYLIACIELLKMPVYEPEDISEATQNDH